MNTCIQNPILPGFHPDPSVCRVGKDFYLVTSSFSFFPGISIYHSEDLCNWEQVGHVFSDPAQLRLNPELLSFGLWAPTLRYHEGRFYCMVINWSTKKTLLMTATHITGPWSQTVFENIGYDGDLFFDEDGRAYCAYCGDGMLFPGHGIMLAELDLDTGKTVGEPVPIWDGAAAGAIAVEAAHLYRRDGWYYLLTSEGGTEYYHAVCIARSRSLKGPYEGFRGNPILTHRNFGLDDPVSNVGHADMVETPAGQWYMFVLASRPYGGYHKNLGRETFLVPMDWQWGWPVVPSGRVNFTYPAPEGLSLHGYAPEPDRVDFSLPLPLCFNTVGTPENTPYRLSEGKLYIRAVKDAPEREYTQTNPFLVPTPDPFPAYALGFVGRRQAHMSFSALTGLRLSFQTGSETAGLALIQNRYCGLRIELAKKGKTTVLRAVKNVNTEPDLWEMALKPCRSREILAEIPWEGNSVVLSIRAEGQDFSLLAGKDEASLFPVAEHIDGSFMGSETAGGFIGAYVGMFASGNGTDSPAEGIFDFFEYKGI